MSGRAYSHFRVASQKSNDRRINRPAGHSRYTLPAYVTIVKGKRVARTDELIEGRVMADYDADGELIGVEVIG